ncbi:MAG: Txe/YoeB family addiction module toxin [Atopobiaceae bacterium]|jgi:toxin YoeB|uniref:Endoribonuclease YoeB n=1 Tax=Muricaecibacterium torontonense TaxID=3032871 RepID=A0A4S2EZ05_9ACTN|nr:Txe/YoeB family addiction module toxin [Muricaecibacterium torontonense]MCI8676457.1 Txe/YoeB family addiction module toxin [Atopobiaceae bacterium]TGY61778.1 Txe/YoeB family addiction module toxin [Muricaecibacterium torontonense]
MSVNRSSQKERHKVWTTDSWEDYLSWQAGDKATLRRINRLVEEICRTPFEGIGKPEPLKGDLSGLWSRRIDHKNRLVYKPEDDCVLFLSLRDHY